jgi:hypothetical protein
MPTAILRGFFRIAKLYRAKSPTELCEPMADCWDDLQQGNLVVDEDEADSVIQEMDILLEKLQDLIDPFFAETAVEPTAAPDTSG